MQAWFYFKEIKIFIRALIGHHPRLSALPATPWLRANCRSGNTRRGQAVSQRQHLNNTRWCTLVSKKITGFVSLKEYFINSRQWFIFLVKTWQLIVLAEIYVHRASSSWIRRELMHPSQVVPSPSCNSKPQDFAQIGSSIFSTTLADCSDITWRNLPNFLESRLK